MTMAAQSPFQGLGLVWHPVAMAFLPKPPADLQRLARPLPAGCSYWKHASEGHSFYTVPDDHVNCPIGAHTHNVPMSPAKQAELQGLVGTMIELQYLSVDEIALIPRRSDPLAVAAYAPLERATFNPDVVIVRGNARQMMLVGEAARAAGVFDRADIMGRPACSMIPFASSSGNAVASFGCIGSRVYTGLDDTELYVTIPGAALKPTLEKLVVILEANRLMEAFYRERQTALS
jgi:uncharacterized protein (DUF169 family)